MKPLHNFFCCILLFSLSAAAAAQANPEVTIYGKASQVKTEVIRQMSRRGFALTRESQHEMTFTRDQAVQPNVLSEVLFGNYNTRAWRTSVQFLMTEDERDVVVSAAAEAIAQDGWGRTSRIDLVQDPAGHADLQRMLTALRLKMNPESKDEESFAPEMAVPKRGTLHLLVLSGKISASYSPAVPARIIAFADEGALLEFLEKNTESSAERRQEWLKEFKAANHLDIEGLGWSAEKLRALGLEAESTTEAAEEK